jgi:hypothetical protein
MIERYLFGGAAGIFMLTVGMARASGMPAVLPFAASSSMPAMPGSVVEPSAVAAWCVNYGKNLGVGSRGTDVAALQKELTVDGEPVPATGYFGPMTAAAVASFQEKYATDVLVPVGLSHGTGYFGPSTRAMLNVFGPSHCAAFNGGISTTTTAGTPPIILNIAPTSSPIGGVVVITGTGFAATDTIDGIFPGGIAASSPDGKTISFTVPGPRGPDCSAAVACPMYILSPLGDHAISVVANGLQSNTTTLSVTLPAPLPAK